MNTYDKTPKDVETLLALGVPMNQINGFQMLDQEDFILREFHSNRREQGYEVPEKYQPQSSTIKERELKFQSKMMYDLEGERVDRVFTGFPSAYKWYDDDELVWDDEENDYIPEWMVEKRKDQEEREESYLIYQKNCKKIMKKKLLEERLKAMKDERLGNIEMAIVEKRRLMLERAIKERVERLNK